MMHFLGGLNDDKARSTGLDQNQHRCEINWIHRCPTLRISAAGTHACAWHFMVHVCAPCGCQTAARQLSLVLVASQSSNRKLHTKYGNTPYSVSLTEWEWRSITTNTWMQNSIANESASHPATETGRNSQPHRRNQVRFMCSLQSSSMSKSNHARDQSTFNVSAKSLGTSVGHPALLDSPPAV